MNKHFEDARYYLKRAGETASRGVKEELEPIEQRFRELTGSDEEPEPSGLEKVKADLNELQQSAEGEAEQAIKDAREKIEAYRGADSSEA